ncbi:ATP-binding protein [Dyadobacter chenwenxiniae]|uniref:histidine kinase n=1 Tax=Dyadobacter chenwenxiniae TaxID=2906456 RepID=A0A9X1PQZ0_9BACT|nr:histidine kinase dimerization/phosphoacceptor domain -containing protein [Dyadobacter chenwenxiniae]MCF0065812.1 ATP-binding protein [Dyadobacter chenwenxiniae]UON84034.1 ATP-binding protein [Dyadobacter chenwenxiniae]
MQLLLHNIPLYCLLDDGCRCKFAERRHFVLNCYRGIRHLSHIGAFYVWAMTACMSQETIKLQVQPKRLKNAQEIEQKAIAARDSILLAEAWYLYGKMYVLAGDYRSAHAYFMKAFRVIEPKGDSFELNRLYRRLAENEERLGHFQEALRLGNQSLAIAQRVRSNPGLAGSYMVLGDIYKRIWETQGSQNQKIYLLAVINYRQTESLCHQVKDSMGIADACVRLGMLYLRANDRQAISYLQRAIKLYHPDEKIGNRIQAMLNLASAFASAGNYQLAFRTIREAEKLYQTKWTADYSLLLEFEKQYIQCYQAVHQWQAAFDHLEKLHKLEKSQLMADNQGAISRLNIAYQTSKKESLLHAQANELSTLHLQQRFFLVTSMLLILTIGLSITFFRLYRKNQRTSRQNQELVKEQNHRVKNNLQVISSLLSLQADQLTDEKARQAIEESYLRVKSMAILHRKLYDGDQLAKVDLEEFIPELVIGILQTFGISKIEPAFFIDPIHLSADKATPFGLILTELITNACKHAFADNPSPKLQISCRQKGRNIHLEVADNGRGLVPQMPMIPLHALLRTQSGTFGIQLIQSQLAQLKADGHFETVRPEAGQGTKFHMDFNA